MSAWETSGLSFLPIVVPTPGVEEELAGGAVVAVVLPSSSSLSPSLSSSLSPSLQLRASRTTRRGAAENAVIVVVRAVLVGAAAAGSHGLQQVVEVKPREHDGVV